MKCDELEEEYLWTNNVKTPSTIMVRAYNADKVDKVIAELKARIQLDDDEIAGFLDLEEECGGGDLRNYIAKKDKEIAELKEQYKDMDVTHTVHIAEMNAKIEEQESKIAELKAASVSTDNSAVIESMAAELEHLRPMETALELAEADNKGYLARIKTLEAKNRRLERALWLARANRALEKIAWFKLWNASISTMNPEDGARQEFDKWKKNLGKFLSKAAQYK